MTEKTIQKNIRFALCRRQDVRVFNNDTGMAYRPKPGFKPNMSLFHPIHYGLVKGGSDLVGWKSITITPEMVGKKVAVFTALEVKVPGKRMNVSEQQKFFLEAVNEAGGISGVVTSTEQA